MSQPSDALASDSLPSNARVYKTTPRFTQDTVPAGLLKAHSTRAGVWGRVVVSEGRLRFRRLQGAAQEQLLTAGQHVVVQPQELHEVQPDPTVVFHVEFLRLETPE